jgi:hypothetical protein
MCYRYKKKSAARDFASKSAVDKVAVLGHSATVDLLNKKLAMTNESAGSSTAATKAPVVISSGSIAATYKYENIDDSKPRTRSNSTISEMDDEPKEKKAKKEKKSKKDKK